MKDLSLSEQAHSLFLKMKRERGLAEKDFQNLPFETQSEIIKSAPAEQARDLLFLSEDARVILKEIPKTRFGELAIQEYLEDSLMILDNCTQEQFNFALDLDIWSKGTINNTRFLEWVETIKEISASQFEHLSQDIDDKLLAACLAPYVLVHLDPDEILLMQHVGQEKMYSLDDIEILNAEIEAFVQFIYHIAPDLYKDIIIHLTLGDHQEIFNEAKGQKDDRLSDVNMPSYEESQTIYTNYHEIDLSFVTESNQTESNSTEILEQQKTDTNFLDKVIQYLNRTNSFEIKEFNQLQRSLAHLANCVLIADGINQGDQFKYRECLLKSKNIFNIGLEYLSRGQPKKGGKIIQAIPPIEIFQYGFSLLSEIQKRASHILEDDDELIARIPKLMAQQLRFMDQKIPMMYSEENKTGKAVKSFHDVRNQFHIIYEVEDFIKHQD